MANKLRAAIIGCGSIARYHAYGYLNSGRYEIVAVADLSAGAMEDFDSLFADYPDYHPGHYTDAHKMLDSELPEVVSVCVWHRGHAEWTIAAAARKPRAIICEKPMAEDLVRAGEMLTVCRRNGVKLVIGHQRRFLPSYTLARELIAEGAIGQAQLLECNSGAGLLNWASHQVDMLRYVLSDDDCLWAMGAVERLTDRYERATRIEDRAMGVFGFEGGARAVLLSDLTTDYYQGCRIFGDEGMIDLTPSRLRVLNAGAGGKWEEHTPDGRYFKAQDDGFDALESGAAQARELADWIEGQVQTHRGEATHGYKAVEMVNAIYESARIHERVSLPLQTKVNPLDLMVESEHLPVRYHGRYDIRIRLLRGENVSTDEENV